MKAKVLQIGYEPERDRLTWDGLDIHCGQGMELLLPDQSMAAHGGLSPLSAVYAWISWCVPSGPVSV